MPAGEAHVVFNALPGMGKDKPLQLKYFLEAGWDKKLGKQKQTLFDLIKKKPGFYILKMPACVKKYKLGIANATPEGVRSTGGSGLGLLNRFRDYVNKFGNAKVLFVMTTVAHPDRAGDRGRNTTVSNFEKRIKRALNPGVMQNYPEWYSVNSDFIEDVKALLKDNGQQDFETQPQEEPDPPAPVAPAPATAPARARAPAQASAPAATRTRGQQAAAAGPSRVSSRQAANKATGRGRNTRR